MTLLWKQTFLKEENQLLWPPGLGGDFCQIFCYIIYKLVKQKSCQVKNYPCSKGYGWNESAHGGKVLSPCPRTKSAQWHRSTSCRSFWEHNDPLWPFRAQRAHSYLEGHVPCSHTDFLFQFLGLSWGPFTLQTTLVQNIVEHLNQENRAVLTDRSQQRDTAEKAEAEGGWEGRVIK